MSDKLHSADYFGNARDFWWNRDFLELMGRRWELSEVKAVSDVGCGVGHEWLGEVDRQNLNMTYGSIMYLVSGRKKGTQT